MCLLGRTGPHRGLFFLAGGGAIRLSLAQGITRLKKKNGPSEVSGGTVFWNAEMPFGKLNRGRGGGGTVGGLGASRGRLSPKEKETKTAKRSE